LSEAVAALREVQKVADRNREKHRSVIVFDRAGHVVGRLTQWDICKGLEPRYEKIGNLRQTSRYGFSPEFIKSMLDAYGLWRKPLDDICRKAANMKVGSIMHKPTEGEYVEESAGLDEAIHQLVMGHHQSLLVTRGDEIVGVLQLSDVFNEICVRMESCEV
jgi:CBS domain-containing protein